jgi:two-component system nitrogen regulation response regulator NtrX
MPDSDKNSRRGAMRMAVELVGQSRAIERVHDLVARAAAQDGGALIVAERGADIVAVAHEVHARGRRSGAPWISVSCGAGQPRELDGALFGRAAITGADDLETIHTASDLAAARGGTLFLQDVAELSAGVQRRLARVLRDGEVRLGSEVVTLDVRVIASASPAIDDDVAANRFRPDLFRRLTTTRIDLPPLRDRSEDVAPIAARMLEEHPTSAVAPRSFTQPALALLAALSWPGNLAELRSVVDRVVRETAADAIQIEHVLPALQLDRAPVAFVPTGSLREARLKFEREYIAAVLKHHNGRMADAAQSLGIQRPNLYRKARQLGIPVSRIHD